MTLWEWLKMRMNRGQLPSRVGEDFDQMLIEERDAARADHADAKQQQRQAREVRERSWYLHGRFEQARTADAFSEWLFSDQPRSEQ